MIIGYSGHAHTVIDLLHESGFQVTAYCDNQPKEQNPSGLEYLGSEMDEAVLGENEGLADYFIGIGNNNLLRRKGYDQVSKVLGACECHTSQRGCFTLGCDDLRAFYFC
ncbi:MAG: hypothetical protein IPP99_12295 [Chitinophagaceae bacterium]|nr:hypothetical protein [Chitinophagaceae bacterium]